MPVLKLDVPCLWFRPLSSWYHVVSIWLYTEKSLKAFKMTSTSDDIVVCCRKVCTNTYILLQFCHVNTWWQMLTDVCMASTHPCNNMCIPSTAVWGGCVLDEDREQTQFLLYQLGHLPQVMLIGLGQNKACLVIHTKTRREGGRESATATLCSCPVNVLMNRPAFC